MQVVFAPPPAAIPGGQPSTEFASGQSGTESSSFASLLDSNSNAPAGATSPVEPPARQSPGPLAPEDAAAGESVADDQEVGAEPEDTPSIDEWLATAVEAAIPFQAAPLPVSQGPAPEPSEVAADADAASPSDVTPGITPAGEEGLLPEGAAPAAASAASAPAIETAGTASAPRLEERQVVPQAAPTRAPANDVVGDADPERVPVSSDVDGDEAPAPLVPGHSDARRDEANPAVAGAIARQVPAAPLAQEPAEPVLPAHAAPQRQATAGPASADSGKAGADVGGAAAPLPVYPNARIVVPPADAPAATPPTTPATDAQDPAAASSPVVAAPTLTQVLVEGSRGRQSRDPAAPEIDTEAEIATSDPASADADTVPQPADDSSTAGLPVAREGKKAAVSQRTSRENLAVTSGRMVKVTSGGASGTLQRNFLSVDGERVGVGESPVGTGAAKESQPMTAPTQVLPTAAPSSLAASEGMSAAASAAWHAAPMATSHAAATSSVHAAAVDAVREAVEAAERAQQTGRNQVDLRLPTSNDESLRVHLRLQDGVIHAKFVAPTTELQQALSREWDLLAPRLAERGIKFGETSFENRDQSGQSMAQNAFTSGQQRQPQHDRGQPYERAEDFASFLSSPAASSTTASRRSPVAASVIAATPASLNTAEARGLHAWA